MKLSQAALIFVFYLSVSSLTEAASFQGLGLFGVFNNTRAIAVSADGRVVAGYGYGNGAQPFRWTAATGIVPIGPSTAVANAISADGSTIVGNTIVTGQFQAFRWTQPSDTESLGSQATFPMSRAFGVSSDGSIAVGAFESAGHQQSFQWNLAEGITPLGSLDTLASAITPDGTIVVGSVTDPTVEAVRWVDGNPQMLGQLPNGVSTNANAVSFDGSVIVGTGVWIPSPGASGLTQAFVWNDVVGLMGLGSLGSGGNNTSAAYGVSGDGSLVVGVTGAALGDQAFLWNDSDGMRLLQDVLVQDYGLNLDGWFLRSAYAISGDGRVIVGEGIGPGNVTQAFIAVIPEPSSVRLSMLALMLIVVHRLRRT